VASLVSLLEVRRLARLYANQRSTAFLDDTEWNTLINAARAELYDMLVESRGHEYFEQTATLATTSGSAILALPADFYELLSLILRWGATQLEELEALDHLGDQVPYREWNSWAQCSPKAFRIRGPLLELFPTPSAVTTVEMRYIPAVVALSSDAETFDSVNGWHKLVAARAAMEALGSQALPTAAAEKIYEREKDRIEGLASKRAAAHPSSIRDVRYGEGPGRGGWWRRRRLPPPP
jgi:hypothetical protein